MGIVVDIKVIKGSNAEKNYSFDSATSVYVGRSSECSKCGRAKSY